MLDSPNASFIPKQTISNKSRRKTAPKQIFLGAFIARLLFFSVLLVAAAIFFYHRHLNEKLNIAVTDFKSATETYKTDIEKFQTIVDMDNRLTLANKLLRDSVSVSILLSSLEQSIAKPIQLTKLDYSRNNEGKRLLEAQILTESFDSTMFQRSLFTNSELFQDITVEDVKISTVMGSSDEKLEDNINLKTGELTFKVAINIDSKLIKSVPTFIPINENSVEPDLNIEPSVDTEMSNSTSTPTSFDNQDNNNI